MPDAASADVTPNNDQNQESSEEPRKGFQWSLRKQEPTKQGERDSAEGKPSDHSPVEFPSVKPEPAAVPHKLGDREDGDSLTHPINRHQDRK